MPAEVLEAKEVYEAEYAKIKDKVVANRLKYKGTKYEDCPPLIEEQSRLAVRGYQLHAELERLKQKYGYCPRIWALYVAWWKKKSEKDIESQRQS